MTETKIQRFDPNELAELLQRTSQDVQRYRRQHPECQRAPTDTDSSALGITGQQAADIETLTTLED